MSDRTTHGSPGSSFLLLLCALITTSLACTDLFERPPSPEATAVCLPGPTEGVCGEVYEEKNGVFSDRLIVGISMPLTGPERKQSIDTLHGIEAYLDHVNQTEGGVHGRLLYLNVYDDRSEDASAQENTDMITASENRVAFALLGSGANATVSAVLPTALERQVNLFAPPSGADVLRQDPPDLYVFTYRASHRQEGRALAKHLLTGRAQPVAPANIMVFSQQDASSTQTSWTRLDVQGVGVFEGVADALKSAAQVPKQDIFLTSYMRNTEIVDGAVEETIRWMASPNRVETNGVIAIGAVLHATPKPGANFVKQLKDALADAQAGQGSIQLTAEEQSRLQKVSLELVSSSAAGDWMARHLKSAQTPTRNYCDGIKITRVVPSLDSAMSGVAAYRDHVKPLSPDSPTFAGLEGYLSARLFVETLRRAGRHLNDHHFAATARAMHDAASGGTGAADMGIGVDLSFSATRTQASSTLWGSALDASCSSNAFTFAP